MCMYEQLTSCLIAAHVVCVLAAPRQMTCKAAKATIFSLEVHGTRPRARGLAEGRRCIYEIYVKFMGSEIIKNSTHIYT